jgi:hypothetical protein
MPFLICMECEVSCSLDNHLKQIRPALCGPLSDGSMKAPRWMEPPLKQFSPYEDPQGEPYKGLTEFIQTPMSDTVKPKTADQLLKEREHRFKLRTEK